MAKFDLHSPSDDSEQTTPGVRICVTEWTGKADDSENSDILVTPNCRSFHEISAQIDLLQSSLEALRRKARIHFQTGPSGPTKQ